MSPLLAQIDRISRLDQERVEQQIKPLLQRQASLEQVTSGLAKDLAIQARNSLPASGTIGTAPLLSPIETPSAPIVATPHAESAKQANQAIIRDKKPHRRKYVRVKRKRMQEASTVTVGHNAYAEPTGQRKMAAARQQLADSVFDQSAPLICCLATIG